MAEDVKVTEEILDKEEEETEVTNVCVNVKNSEKEDSTSVAMVAGAVSGAIVTGVILLGGKIKTKFHNWREKRKAKKSEPEVEVETTVKKTRSKKAENSENSEN